MAHRGSRGIALPFHDHGTRRGRGVSVMPRPLFTPGKDPVPIVQEAGWAPGLVWTGAENLVPTGIRSPDHTARSQSLYQLRYPAHSKGQSQYFNLLASRFKWPQSPSAYDILFARHLNFSTCFTKKVNISGTKQD